MKILQITLILLLSTNVFSEKVYFINLKNGDMLKSPFFVQFGLSGKGVAPAGVEVANTGHHHLLINIDELTPSVVIPTSIDGSFKII